MPITINGSGTVTGISAGGLPDGVITTDDLAADAVTSAKIADGTIVNADINSSAAIADSKLSGTTCKAWVNFNGTSNSNNLSGTYSQSGTTVTVTATAHGLIAGNIVYADATSGTAVDGTYTVATVTDANTFTYTAGTSLTTSGNITLRRNPIRGSYNVSSVTDNGTGDYTVNFTTALADANFCAVVLAGTETQTETYAPATTGAYSTGSFRFVNQRGGVGPTDTAQCNVAIFR